MPLNKSWHDYNESLIERGRILMDIGLLKSQGNEIKMMNDGKVGAPFEYSHTYIQFLAFLNRVLHRTTLFLSSCRLAVFFYVLSVVIVKLTVERSVSRWMPLILVAYSLARSLVITITWHRISAVFT